MKNFDEVLNSLSSDLLEVNKIILDFSKGKSPLIQEISHHLISSGGKRIRPILLILSAKLCGTNSGNFHHNLAAAVELIHSATLLHDDVVDASEIRRGKKTANAIWDNKSTILVGDYLFSVAFQLMVKCGNLEILDLLSKSSSTMADGEVMQLENSSNIDLSIEKYLEIIFGKTAVLFSAACESGALLNKRKDEEIISLRNFGKNLGIIFQIIDDILDYSSQEKTLGKDLGNDFFEGKITLPIIITYRDSDEKELIAKIFSENLIGNEKNWNNFNKIHELMQKTSSIEKSKEIALIHHKKALKDLEIFTNSKDKESLIAILDYSLSRIF